LIGKRRESEIVVLPRPLIAGIDVTGQQ
jgi:hypothetical protein